MRYANSYEQPLLLLVTLRSLTHSNLISFVLGSTKTPLFVQRSVFCAIITMPLRFLYDLLPTAVKHDRESVKTYQVLYMEVLHTPSVHKSLTCLHLAHNQFALYQVTRVVVWLFARHPCGTFLAIFMREQNCA